jgi:hypothetical protein
MENQGKSCADARASASTLKAIGIPAIAAALVVGLAGHLAVAQQEARIMRIRIVLPDQTLTATLVDNATARDFAALLPLTLTLSEHAATEKISDLPRKLSEEGAPDGIDPVAGDIAYYAPWGNLAIFHRGFRYSRQLIRLGTIDAGIDILKRSGPLAVRIERTDD